MLCNLLHHIVKKTPLEGLYITGHSFNGKTSALGAGDIGSNPVDLIK